MPLQPELAGIELQTEVERQQSQHDEDQADRNSLDPQHHFGGEFDVAIGDASRDGADQRKRGNAPAGAQWKNCCESTVA